MQQHTPAPCWKRWCRSNTVAVATTTCMKELMHTRKKVRMAIGIIVLCFVVRGFVLQRRGVIEAFSMEEDAKIWQVPVTPQGAEINATKYLRPLADTWPKEEIQVSKVIVPRVAPIIWLNKHGHQVVQAIDDTFENSTVLKEFGWIRDYTSWHSEMRQKFQGPQLLEHPDAPNVLIVFVDHLTTGGLHDRFQKIGPLLYHCHISRRILLLKWYAPMPLENFLVPNLFNWTVPDHRNVSTSGRLKEFYGIFDKRDTTSKIVRSEKFHQKFHKKNLRPIPAPAGVIWYVCFKPSPRVQAELDETYSRLGLVPGRYNAIHLRVRHPAHTNSVKPVTADKNGLNFTGDDKRKAMESAIHAIHCSNWLISSIRTESAEIDMEPSYFYSDSEDLVQNVIHNPSGENFSSLEVTMHNLSSHSRIVGRTVEYPIAHIISRGHLVESYTSGFVDLLIAASARCVTLGVGRFAYLAALISGTECWTLHEVADQEVRLRWGMRGMLEAIGECPVPPNWNASVGINIATLSPPIIKKYAKKGMKKRGEKKRMKKRRETQA
jgi:hypothetical protein